MSVNTTDIHISKTSMNFYQLSSDNSVGFQYMLTTLLCNFLCKAWGSQFWYQNNITWLCQEQEKTAAARKSKNPPLLDWPPSPFLCIMIQVKTFFKIKKMPPNESLDFFLSRNTGMDSLFQISWNSTRLFDNDPLTFLATWEVWVVRALQFSLGKE